MSASEADSAPAPKAQQAPTALDLNILFHEGRIEEAEEGQQPKDAASAGKKHRKSQASLMVELAQEEVLELFHDRSGDAYADIRVAEDGRRETLRVKSSAFRRYLRRLLYQVSEQGASTNALQEAIGTLDSIAAFGGEQREVALRVAGTEEEVFLDLAADAMSVHITVQGWEIVPLADTAPRFLHPPGLLPLPQPTCGGDLDRLWQFLNIVEADRVLFLAVLLYIMFRPYGPYIVLVLLGEQGSAKTATSRVLKALADPAEQPVRSFPRETWDLMIAARNARLLVFDNLSYLRNEQSDELCRLATLSGFGVRTRYENDEETTFGGQRPIIINSISDTAERPDLLDRSVLFTLPNIPEHRRRAEAEFWRNFAVATPSILGAMCDIMVKVLAELPGVPERGLLRMADFHRFGIATERALGWAEGTFTDAYRMNRRGANETALDSSPVGRAILSAIKEAGFSGTPAELLAVLDASVSDKVREMKIWPKTAQWLTGTLTRLAPALRAYGYAVDTGRRHERFITIQIPGENGDATDQEELEL